MMVHRCDSHTFITFCEYCYVNVTTENANSLQQNYESTVPFKTKIITNYTRNLAPSSQETNTVFVIKTTRLMQFKKKNCCL